MKLILAVTTVITARLKAPITFHCNVCFVIDLGLTNIYNFILRFTWILYKVLTKICLQSLDSGTQFNATNQILIRSPKDRLHLYHRWLTWSNFHIPIFLFLFIYFHRLYLFSLFVHTTFFQFNLFLLPKIFNQINFHSFLHSPFQLFFFFWHSLPFLSSQNVMPLALQI